MANPTSIPAVAGQFYSTNQYSTAIVPRPSTANVAIGNLFVLIAGINSATILLQSTTDGVSWSTAATYTANGLYKLTGLSLTTQYRLTPSVFTSGLVNYAMWNEELANWLDYHPQTVDMVARQIATEGNFQQPITLPASTVAQLPAAASYTNGVAIVTDANTPTLGSTVTGGGAVRVMVTSDGTNWKVA